MDNLPPHSLEAEEGVLSCILQSPRECLPECQEQNIQPDTFYGESHGIIYRVMVKVGQFDPNTLAQALRDAGQLEDIGGHVRLAELTDKSPSATHLEYYTKIVLEKAMLRKLWVMSHNNLVEIPKADNADALLERVEVEVLSIRSDSTAGEEYSAKELVLKAIDKVERCVERKGQLDGLSYGFHDIDHMTWGMRPGELVVVAARPSCGKTSLCMNIAEDVAVRQGQPVGVFSLETMADTLMFRMLCSRARVDSMRVRRGELLEGDRRKLEVAGLQLAPAPLYVRDRSGLSIGQIRAAARRMHKKHGIKLFIVDYLQLTKSETKRGENREREVAQVSNGLKTLAKELNVPVIVISATNRESDKETRKPRLSDLRESGQLEFDADVAMLLYRPTEQGKPPPNPNDPEFQVNIFIAKQKEGPIGDVPLWFKKTFTRFESMDNSRRDEPKINPEDTQWGGNN